MNKYLIRLHQKLFVFYDKWADRDAFFTTSFILSTLIASTINFLISLTFAITNLEVLKFNLFPNGLLLLVFVFCFTFFLDFKKKEIMENISKYSRLEDLLILVIIFFMLSTWILAPLLYKIGDRST